MPGFLTLALAGILFAGAALTRTIGALAIAPALATVLFLRPGVSRALVFVALCTLPLAAYAVWYRSYHPEYALSGVGSVPLRAGRAVRRL